MYLPPGGEIISPRVKEELFPLLSAALGYVSRGDDNRLVPSSTEASRCYSRTQSA
jgi:hypothetical protein